MTGILSEIFLYKGSEVDDHFANFLIDVIYREQKLFLINVERNAKHKLEKVEV